MKSECEVCDATKAEYFNTAEAQKNHRPTSWMDKLIYRFILMMDRIKTNNPQLAQDGIYSHCIDYYHREDALK